MDSGDSFGLPKQLHVSKLPAASLKLGPGQVAIIPVSFIPRFPHSKCTSWISPAGLTHTQQADLEEWLAQTLDSSKPPPVRSNRGIDFPFIEEYLVATIIMVETSRGRVDLPILASSIRRNDYGLPDLIRFDWQQTTPRDLLPGDKSALIKTTKRSLEQPSTTTVVYDNNTDNHDCYDLYLKHPLGKSADNNLQVTEVLLNVPDHVSLQVLPEKSSHKKLLRSFPRQVIRKWTSDGPLSIPADGQQHYVVTICALGVEPDKQLATDYLQDMEVEPSVGVGFLQIQTDMDTLFVSLERMIDDDEVDEEDCMLPASVAPKTKLTLDDEPDADDHVEAVLYSKPAVIDIHLLSSASPTARIPINVYNGGSQSPVTVMRVSAVWKTSEPGLDERVGFQLTLPGKGLNEPIPIELNTTLEDAFYFECSIDWSKFMKDSSLDTIQFTGTVILRASSRNWDYDVWELAMKTNPYTDVDLVVEIPFSVTIVKGKIGFVVEESTHPQSLFWSKEPWKNNVESVSSAFFPRTTSDARASLEGQGPNAYYHRDTMEHSLRIWSNVDVKTEVKQVEIVDSNGVYEEKQKRISQDSLCALFDVSYTRSKEAYPFDTSDHTDLGLVKLKYQFYGDEWMGPQNETSSTICNLRLTTEPDTGNHLIPLIIYAASIEVSGSHFRSVAVSEADESGDEMSVWQRTIVGFDKILTWLQNTKAGSSLRSAINLSLDVKKSDSDDQLLKRYLSGLAGLSLTRSNSKMRPVLLQAGAIAQGELETLPLYLTNHNPVPIMATINVGEVEGMSIVLGRDHTNGKGDGNSLLDHLSKKTDTRLLRDKTKNSEPTVESGRFLGHPLYGLRQFLSNDQTAATFLSQFPYKDAVTLSETAVLKTPFLKDLFKRYMLVHFHKAPLPTRLSPNSWSRCNPKAHPPPYGPFPKKLTGPRLPCPIIVSDDGKKARRLPVCWDKDGEPENERTEGTSILLPPGGVARFEISIRSPPYSVLEKDITQFFATGLVLSTDHGEIMPIFVSFASLQGKLEISHIPSSHLRDENSPVIKREGVITVPLVFFGQPSKTVTAALQIPPWKRSFASLASGGAVIRNASSPGTGVSLFMRSSFSRDVRLREVSSCNPWFEVVLNSNQMAETDPFLGVNIGVVNSIVSCDNNVSGLSSNLTGQPVFFRCALSWLSKRATLQPRGCGLLPTKATRTFDNEGNQVAERAGVDRAVRALKRALVVLYAVKIPSFDSNPYVAGPMARSYKSYRRRSDGILPQAFIDVIAEVWDSWRTVSELGLRTLSTSLRAVIEYNLTARNESEDSIRTHVLSVALPNLTIESVLEAPRLLDASRGSPHHIKLVVGANGSPSVVQFPSIRVAGVVPIYLPLRNPTAVPVRVRLAVALPYDNAKEASQLKDFNIDNAVRRRFVGDLPSPYVQSRKPQKSFQSKVVHDRWWDGDGGFFLTNYNGDVIRSFHNATLGAAQASIVLCNPVLQASNAMLNSCGTRCGLRDEPRKNGAHVFPIGASAAIGMTLVGRKRSKKSHENFIASDIHKIEAGGALRDGGSGPSAFAIPYSALDEIVLPPFGEAEIGPILLRPPGRFRHLGCDAIKQGHTAKICEADAFESMVFLENSLSGLEAIKLTGRALWDGVEFLEPPNDGFSEKFGNIEYRNGRTSLMFPGSDLPTDSGLNAGVFVIKNTGDIAKHFKSMFFSHTAEIHSTRDEKERHYCELNGFSLVDCDLSRAGFSLLPGQERTIKIRHIPTCTKKTEFVSLNVEVNRSVDGLRHQLKEVIDDPRISLSLSRSGGRRLRKANLISRSAARGKYELLVGYDMSKKDFKHCLPASRQANAKVDHKQLGGSFAAGPWSEFQSMCQSMWSMLKVLVLIFVVPAAITFLWKRCKSRLAATYNFHMVLNGSKSKTTSGIYPGLIGTNWYAAFRCLARADPSSIDLQNIGKEQVRHVVLARYRSLGALQPQCLSNTGAFNRERVGGVNGGGRAGKVGTTNERIRTLSDAIFCNFRPNGDVALGLLPSELEWKTAAAKGIMKCTTYSKTPELATLRTPLLLKMRKQELVCAAGSTDHESDDDESSRGSSDSSYENSVTFHTSGDYDGEGDKDDTSAERQCPATSEVNVPVPTFRNKVPSRTNFKTESCLDEEIKLSAAADNDLEPSSAKPQSQLESVSQPLVEVVDPNSEWTTIPVSTNSRPDISLSSDALSADDDSLSKQEQYLHQNDKSDKKQNRWMHSPKQGHERSTENKVSLSSKQLIGLPNQGRNTYQPNLKNEVALNQQSKNLSQITSPLSKKLHETQPYKPQDSSVQRASPAKQQPADKDDVTKADEKAAVNRNVIRTKKDKSKPLPKVISNSKSQPAEEESTYKSENQAETPRSSIPKQSRRKSNETSSPAATRTLSRIQDETNKFDSTEGSFMNGDDVGIVVFEGKKDQTKRSKKERVKKRKSRSSNQLKPVADQYIPRYDAANNLRDTLEHDSPLRLPPGLSPPPGFFSPNVPLSEEAAAAAAAAATSILADTSLRHVTSSGAIETTDISIRPESISRAISLDSMDLDAPDRSQILGFYDRQAEQHASMSGGFDVMDFLDGILNDGGATAEEANDGGFVAEYSGDRLDATMATPVISANPWASTREEEPHSRLSDYGVSIDDESERDVVSVGDPVLYPSEIITATVEIPSDEDSQKGASFYASLLRE
jgi:hypothetical protein